MNSHLTIVSDKPAAAASPLVALELPTISPAHLHAINAFYRRRRTLTISVAGRSIAIAAQWPANETDARADVPLTINVDDEPVELMLPRPLLEFLIGTADGALSLERLRPDHAGLVIEFVLADALGAIERVTGWKLEVRSVGAPASSRHDATRAALSAAIVADGLGRWPCELRLPPRLAVKLAHHLDLAAGLEEPLPTLPVALCLRVAAVTLTAAELHGLSAGDVVLLDAHCPGGSAVAVFGEHWLAPVALDDAGARLTAAPIPGRGSQWEWIMEKQRDAAKGAAPEATDLDALPVQVVIELGRLELELAEVRRLAPGAILPLTRPLDEPLDIIANGRRIGRGTLVRIGDSTGIRITRLLGNG
ncbi:MAG: type III secretion system cytoplasmic ring protein SctQ [Bradyrhizobium sp.]|uniref:type III secretion system cytoplasmic ring protein SctQ n=1 Tax=Bradyrhizobium sp. TaxID=376 RepID=UPI001DF19808|nr:type III secretion system cytoplasmic ring protein SctQ [Bradyrhizobium sp.]MBV9559151.1 type III secretion system cytoplasmic ring protein SctQ [Bradyrhizobium sp.]